MPKKPKPNAFDKLGVYDNGLANAAEHKFQSEKLAEDLAHAFRQVSGDNNALEQFRGLMYHRVLFSGLVSDPKKVGDCAKELSRLLDRCSLQKYGSANLAKQLGESDATFYPSMIPHLMEEIEAKRDPAHMVQMLNGEIQRYAIRPEDIDAHAKVFRGVLEAAKPDHMGSVARVMAEALKREKMGIEDVPKAGEDIVGIFKGGVHELHGWRADELKGLAVHAAKGVFLSMLPILRTMAERGQRHEITQTVSNLDTQLRSRNLLSTKQIRAMLPLMAEVAGRGQAPHRVLNLISEANREHPELGWGPTTIKHLLTYVRKHPKSSPTEVVETTVMARVAGMEWPDVIKTQDRFFKKGHYPTPGTMKEYLGRFGK